MNIVMMKSIASGAGLQVMVRGVCILRRRSIGMGQARTSAFGVVRRRRVRGACIHRRGVTRNNPRQILFGLVTLCDQFGKDCCGGCAVKE